MVDAGSLRVERIVHPGHLANTWIVAHEKDALIVDAGAPAAAVEGAVSRLGVAPRLLFITHHHHDHVEHAARWRSLWNAPVAMAAWEAEAAGLVPDITVGDGSRCGAGAITGTVWEIPGHTRAQLALHVDGLGLFTGDTLFKGSVGGSRAPGHGTFEQLRSSLARCAALPPGERVFPGHGEETRMGVECSSNPLLRVITGKVAEPGRGKPCRIRGSEAELLVQAPDYDGGSKGLVRWPDGSRDVVPGSWIEPLWVTGKAPYCSGSAARS